MSVYLQENHGRAEFFEIDVFSGAGYTVVERGGMRVFPGREFERRFQEILFELDELAEGSEGDADDLEDLNAELEDSLMLLDELRKEDDREALTEALEDLEALCGDYAALYDRFEGLENITRRLWLTAEMAHKNLKEPE